MAITGRKLKPPGEAVTRHKPTYEWVDVDDVPFEGGPKLPARRVNGNPWPRTSKRRWEIWSRMPHAALWDVADWEFAVQTLELSTQFDEGKVTVATELRNREKVLGTTWDFRRDLRIRYVEPKQAKLAAVVSADDFRGTD